ncbi:rhomboid family intramembrane serine protease [Litorivita sp. NS0012-18]|uniref:rhomboid family intramembrane serine protease n=1 Tax=Litorivita sp. NS0012-18 TaxID=3127655 RepID=UPI00310551BC
MSRQAQKRAAGAPLALYVILGLCLIPELALMGADKGLWGTSLWRNLVYQYGAFWPGLLDNWRANYPLQSLTMFLSYGFLHAGVWHFGLNMMTLFSLGTPLANDFGQGRFLALYAAAIFGGALGYALLGQGSQPMVGASGALFGLAAAFIRRDWRAAPEGKAVQALFLPILGLIALNVLMYWTMGGRLAWQTHLGGFIAGWMAAVFLAPPARSD